MKQAVTLQGLIEAFQRKGLGNHFTPEGYEALYLHLLEYEYDINEEMDLDVPLLCGTYGEYESIEQYNDERGTEFRDLDELDEYRTIIRVPPSARFISEKW